jgi:hypothetical protein
MFAGLARYLAALPNGLDSYPKCVAKASLLRGVLEVWGGAHRMKGLDEPLASIIRDPPPPTAWLPEVIYVAAHYAIADFDQLEDDAVLELTYRANRRLTQSRMYAAVAKLASPELLLRGASLSWGLLHKGVPLRVIARSGTAKLTVRHPDNLWTSMGHRSAAGGFRAVVEAAHGKEVVSRVVSSDAGGADFEIRWRS